MCWQEDFPVSQTCQMSNGKQYPKPGTINNHTKADRDDPWMKQRNKKINHHLQVSSSTPFPECSPSRNSLTPFFADVCNKNKTSGALENPKAPTRNDTVSSSQSKSRVVRYGACDLCACRQHRRICIFISSLHSPYSSPGQAA